MIQDLIDNSSLRQRHAWAIGCAVRAFSLTYSNQRPGLLPQLHQIISLAANAADTRQAEAITGLVKYLSTIHAKTDDPWVKDQIEIAIHTSKLMQSWDDAVAQALHDVSLEFAVDKTGEAAKQREDITHTCTSS